MGWPASTEKPEVDGVLYVRYELVQLFVPGVTWVAFCTDTVARPVFWPMVILWVKPDEEDIVGRAYDTIVLVPE